MRTNRKSSTKWDGAGPKHKHPGRPKGAPNKYAGAILQVPTNAIYESLGNDGCFVRRNHLCE